MSARARRAAGLAAAVLLAGCGTNLSAVDPAGPQAARIAGLAGFLTVAGSAVFLVVVGFLLYAVWRGHRRAESAGGPEVERRMALWVGGGLAATVAVLAAVLLHNLATGRALAAFAEPDALVVRVTGQQWWWEVEYQDPSPHRRLLTANEIHVPVGRRVRVEVESSDVIHSFWVPNLHGKLDLIPGYSGVTYLRADRPGVYHGRCAEYCGLQHARMDLRVVAEPPERFAAWYEAQLRAAPPPADSLQQKGQQVFLTRKCAMCHTIRGTPAQSRIGPDLTHLASRGTIASGTLPNTRGHLAGWVVDPQRIKPGARMPPNQLASDELHALLDYLQSLK
ncbi:MAG TPA: cytochrome c oxidase subunit II [Longimicrobiaceae bacterium]|nr:cytochrome c oxidase subunit II [Longimicrobiaceae bacterium]